MTFTVFCSFALLGIWTIGGVVLEIYLKLSSKRKLSEKQMQKFIAIWVLGLMAILCLTFKHIYGFMYATFS